MLQNIDLGHLPSFREGAHVRDLQDVNFIFGPNGSGKSSISSHIGGLGDLVHDGSVSNVEYAVYDAGFADRILQSSTTIPGVFTVGEEGSELLRRIDELSGSEGEIAKAQKKVDKLSQRLGDDESKSGMRKELRDARSGFDEIAWKKKGGLSSKIQGLLKGGIGTKKLFSENILKASKVDALIPDAERALENAGEPESLAEIEASIDSLSSSAEESIENIDLVPVSGIFEISGYELFGRAITSSANTPLANSLRRIGSIDWAVQGAHFADGEDHCPMCYQSLTDTLREMILSLNDEAYIVDIASLENFSSVASRRLFASSDGLDRLIESSLGSESDKAKIEAARSEITAAETSITSKAESPSRGVNLPDVDGKISLVNDFIRTENSRRERFRGLRSDRRAALAHFAKEAWRIISNDLTKEIATYLAGIREIEKRIQRQLERVNIATDEKQALQLQLDEARGALRSHKPWLDDANSLLRSIGFMSFHIEDSTDVEGAYRLSRSDGSPAMKTLSEGERTFVSFYYFVSSLMSVPESGEVPSRVVVIDDPIASLDSDVMFMVSGLTKRIANAARKKINKISQMFLLTHNIHFLKEVSYVRRGEDQSGRGFYILSKAEDGTTVSDRLNSNPIKVEYSRLWDEIGKWRSSGDSAVGIQNAMRKIIEYYFQTIGRVNEGRIVGKFTGEDAVVARSFFSWINEGSHSLFDGLFLAPSEASSAMYYRVFEEIFTKSGHGGHYEMMTESWS